MSFQSNFDGPPPRSPSAERMKQAFDDARRKAEAEAFRSPEQWQRLQEIERQAERLRQLSQKRYKNEYKDLVNNETRRLFAEHYSPQRDHKPKDVANSNNFTRQAQKNVRKRQEARIAWIDRSEKNQAERLRDQSRDKPFRDVSFERPAQERAKNQEKGGLTREFRRLR
ncbi:hypothetical protein ACSSV4_004417 [Roseovarius sp. MBR-154]